MSYNGRLSEVSRNILQEVFASYPDGLHLVSKTVLLLEERGAVNRINNRLHITPYGLRVLKCGKWVK